MTKVQPEPRRAMRVPTPLVPAGIYGTVICASILASAGDEPAARVALVVLVTLFVYWLAERYAEVLGLAASVDDNAPGGQLGSSQITAAHVSHVLRSGWPMIQASLTPLLVLLGSRVLGASTETAVDIALAYTVCLLVALGWLAATRAGLVGWSRIAAASFAAFLGLLVILLKASLH